MNSIGSVMCLMALAVSVATITAIPVNFTYPVGSSEDDAIDTWPFEQHLHGEVYAGYLRGFGRGEEPQWTYYWFIDSLDKPATDPIIVWLNGGPGATSLSLPWEQFDHLQDKRWSKKANILVIDCPGVGYSYGGNSSTIMSDDSTASANYNALKSFMRKFPKYRKNKIYITGVSYGSVHVTLLGLLVDRDTQFNLKGIAIRNGAFDDRTQQFSSILFAFFHGLVGEEVVTEMREACCGRGGLWVNNCKSTGPRCVGFLTQNYNKLYDDWFDEFNVYNQMTRSFGLNRIRRSSETNGELCENVTNSFLKELAKEREVFHIPTELAVAEKFKYCVQYVNKPPGLLTKLGDLISSKRNLTVLVYNGDTDFACDFVGTQWFINRLELKSRNSSSPWIAGGKVAGLVQHYEGLTYATIHGAGHFNDVYGIELELISRFLDSKDRNVDLPVRKKEVINVH